MERRQNCKLVSLIPTPISFLSCPASAAVFWDLPTTPQRRLNGLQTWPVFPFSHPSALCYFIHTFLFWQHCIWCWASSSTFVLGHLWGWTLPVSQGPRDLHCQEYVVQHLHHTTSFPLLKSLKNRVNWEISWVTLKAFHGAPVNIDLFIPILINWKPLLRLK